MRNIQIEGNGIVLKDITEQEAQDVYLWYSDSKDYKQATGLKSGLDLQEFYDLWRQAVLKEEEFFLSIFIKRINRCLGFIKGEIVKDCGISVYISAFAVEKHIRRKKIGTTALNTLLEYLKNEIGCSSVFVTVYADNQTGINFWTKNGFHSVKAISKNAPVENSVISALFMKRDI